MVETVATGYGIVKRTLRKWFDDDAFELAAAIAYYTLFSLAPILLIAITVASLAFGEEAARGQVAQQIQRLTGPQGAGVVQNMIDNAYKSRGSVWAAVVSIGVILVGATGVFSEIKIALNKIWGVTKQHNKSTVWGLIKKRLLAFLLVLGVGVLLLALILASTVVSAAVSFLPDVAGSDKVLLRGGDVLVSLAVMAVLFAAIYKLLPDCDIAWGDVRTGALVTAVLFTLGKLGIGVYLGHKAVASTYGAAGSVIVILLGIYYSALIFLLGAEFTNVYATSYGSRRSDHVGAAAGPPAQEGGSETPAAVVTLQAAAAGRAVSAGHKGVVTRDGEALALRAETESAKTGITQTLREPEGNLRDAANPVGWAREHRWAAVGVAMVAGVALGALGLRGRPPS